MASGSAGTPRQRPTAAPSAATSTTGNTTSKKTLSTGGPRRLSKPAASSGAIRLRIPRERLLYWVRPTSDGPQRGQMAASMADAWSRTMDGGGLLIVAGGATLSVPSVQLHGYFLYEF